MSPMDQRQLSPVNLAVDSQGNKNEEGLQIQEGADSAWIAIEPPGSWLESDIGEYASQCYRAQILTGAYHIYSQL
jgi:hypothetical protein